jgi:NADPH:quinone reductase-like Zn-dependent oxidoreductase
MDSRSLNFADEILETTGGRGVDVILNSLAGEAIARGISILSPTGRLLKLASATSTPTARLACSRSART